MKRVLLLTTGGTIVARNSELGLRPQLGAAELLDFFPDLQKSYEIDVENVLNLDSSNIQAEEWQIIARAVMKGLDSHDGIVITHGTDTMAYTSSALSFMLQNLHKPVVITGSQIPIDHPLTDARNNLYSAFLAVDNDVQGVSIAFDHKIIKGCRAVKVRTMGFEAFESVNAPYIGVIYVDGMHINRFFLPATNLPTVLKDQMCGDVFLLKLIPGTNPDIFKMLRNMNYRGVVLETFGAGGMHFLRRNLLPELKQLTDSGISVVACSQCLYEGSDFSIYEVGTRLLDAGVIPAHDMTTEAVVTKLMWALGQTDDPQEVFRIFRTNYVGEITQ
jgi:L-asparaginase